MFPFQGSYLKNVQVTYFGLESCNNANSGPSSLGLGLLRMLDIF